MHLLKGIFCKRALLADGWANDVVIEFDQAGDIVSLKAGGEAGDFMRASGPVVPGMPNLHSHAFQRAMAGLNQRAGPGDDSFWTWRETMYSFLRTLTPEAIEAIAARLYADMLKHGYTAVGEFHYVHHAADGAPYACRAELSHRVISAAVQAGIGITQLPVLYAYGGFGAVEAQPEQRRFINDLDGFGEILEDLFSRYRSEPQIRIGIAPHSLRAVTPELLAGAAAMLERFDSSAPVHIHIAEQRREVDECLRWSGQRPVQWLFNRVDVDARWCLIHATHINTEEIQRLAASRAVAGLCPTTEADLGDGIFPALQFVHANGRFGIGSDSHVSISPAEELRLLEYGQRLKHRKRNLLRFPGTDSVGAGLYHAALAGGAQALGRPLGKIAPAHRADLIILDDSQALLAGKKDDQILDTWLFSGDRTLIRDVIVGGQHIVQDGQHVYEEDINRALRAASRVLDND